MKIACIIHSLSGGGAERVMAGLASRLAARDHDVALITLGDGSNDRHDVDQQVTRHALDVLSDGGNLLTRLVNTRRRIRSLRAAIQQAAPDVVLSFCDRTNVLTLVAARRQDVPVVVSERSDPSQQSLGPFWDRLRIRTYRRAAAVVAQTSTAAEHLRQNLGRPVDVIPSAIESLPQCSDRVTAQRGRRIVSVGRLEDEKGFDRLIEAFANFSNQLPDREPQWSLRILGEGSLRGQLEDQIENLGLADQVSLPGWIRPVWDELAQSTFFVLPSRYEGFPSALLEAMALGVPSLAVDCESGPRAIVTDEVNGLLVANDIASLTAGMLRMISESESREQWGQAGRQVVDQFGWESMVDAYEKILRDSVPL